jgi:superfamily II DNA or RNA helicase
MSTREAVKEAILGISNRNLLIELPTGHGKTAVALELLKSRCKKGDKVLVVVPRIVLKANFMQEVRKWWPNNQIKFTLVTYRSLHKCKGKWAAVVYDEAHHITSKCAEYIKDICAESSILLSATVGNKCKDLLNNTFTNLGFYKRTIRQAMDEGVLPDPKVFLIPIELDNTKPTELLVYNPKLINKVTTTWKDRWNYIRRKDIKVEVICTKRQYLCDLDSKIEWLKGKCNKNPNPALRNMYLHKCGDRLKILSNWKTDYIRDILRKFKNYRTLTFCNSIMHTEALGRFCINSKNKLSDQLLQDFNAGKINHITSCNMLNEGINLLNCRIGIYAVLNSSTILIKQKLGRLLRHPKPVLIIPYYVRTREEEIVNEMIKDYNPDLIKVINNINEISL